MRQRHKPAPLTVQVTQAERRVLYRRRLVDYHASRLAQNLRRGLTSPVVLLVAGGLGFAAEHFTRRQASALGHTERASPGKLFAALKFASMATTLFRHLAPVADPPQAGLPSQPPGTTI
jgi:hypothetical protein